MLGWGAHSPRCPSHSDPPELFAEIVERHGAHPTLRKDDVPSMGDEQALAQRKYGLETGIARRTAAVVDLMSRERWDLFLTYFSEIHSGQHYFWHLSHPDHPLFQHFGTPGRDPLLELAQAVDRGIGQIVAAMPADARLVLFSDHGTESNTTDVPSTVFLPELLYRLAFPGRYGLAKGGSGAPGPVVKPRANRSWRSTLYGLKHDPNPITRWLRQHLDTTWMRANHYRHWWFSKGTARALMEQWHPVSEMGLDLAGVPRILGVPRFMWRSVAEDVAQWVAAILTSDARRRIEREAMLAFAAGYGAGRLRVDRRRRAAPDTRADAPRGECAAAPPASSPTQI